MPLGAIADVAVPDVAFSTPFGLLAGWASAFLALRFTRRRRIHIGVFGGSWPIYLAAIGWRM